MNELTFKIAERNDSGLILEYIKKLADYEHRLDEVIATEKDIEKWVFDEKQAEVIFALLDGDVIGLEKNGTEAELHVYSKVDGRETASSELGAAVLLSYEKLGCEELSGDERMVVVGDDAYLLDSKTWELRTSINDNFITYSPAARKFMLGDADEWQTGHAPYRTLEEMIDEARAVLE